MAFKLLLLNLNRYFPIILTKTGKVKPISVCFYSTKKEKGADEDYCVDLVRKYDYENYLSCLLLPSKIRRSAFAIHAFNVELALIRDLVSAPHLGLMRLQFWTDAIEKIYKKPLKPPVHPVCFELCSAKENHGLSKMWFKRLIEAREVSLGDKPYQTIKQLEEYSEKSVTPVYLLCLESLGANDLKADHAASHLGKGQGIINHLRGIVHNASRGRVSVPIELLTKHKISQESVLRGKVDQKMCDLFFDLASVGHDHIEKALSLRSELGKHRATSVLLPVVSCGNYLKRLEKVNFNVFDSTVQRRNNYLPFLLYMNHLKKYF